MKRTAITVLTIGALMGSASYLISQDEPRGPRRGGDGGGGGFRMQFPLLVALDKNEDGELSKEEIEGAVAALKTLDKDEDGKLNRTEIFGERRARGGERFRRGDREGDGGERPDRPQRDDSSDADN